MGFLDFKTEAISCSSCDWNGVGGECSQGDVFRFSVEYCCPKCGETLADVTFPSDEEILNHPGSSEREMENAAARIAIAEKHERTKLKDPSQLPDLEGRCIHLVWDVDDSCYPREVVIRYGDQAIWRERSFFENFERFIEVGEILKAKYGNRLEDIIPSKAAGYDLYGDFYPSLHQIEHFRKKVIARKAEEDDHPDG